MKEQIYPLSSNKTLIKKIRSITTRNFQQLPQIQHSLSIEDQQAIKIVAEVLPFKANNYVTNELIDWSDPKSDPIFRLTFPQKGMLSEDHFQSVESTFINGRPGPETRKTVDEIRHELNPHPAGQQKNVPILRGVPLKGIQHKYRETLLFFPSHGQTCHAYCTFCFRWPQFTGIDDLRFAMKETELLIEYLKQNPEITDVLFTGGDPMIMSAKILSTYITPLLEANLPHLKTIRIGSKSLAYWPYRYLSDKDAGEVLKVFERVVQNGINLAFMAHFNHPKELQSLAVRKAIRRIRNTGAIIRTQSPIMNHINKSAEVWKNMWKEQVKLGCVPYYMFVARDTGAQDYFAVTLEESWKIFKKAYSQVSGIARTVRGPSMSADPGKIQILGIQKVDQKKYFVLRYLQSREPAKVAQPFLAEYDPKAIWWDELKVINPPVQN
jgi:KamA family protein